MTASRRKKTDIQPADGAVSSPQTTFPGNEGPEVPTDATNGALSEPPPSPLPPPQSENGSSERLPVHVFSYLIGYDTYVQASIWQREVTRKDGRPFTTWDISVRKRYRGARDGEWKTLYSFAASEVYAVQFALQQAAFYVADLRAAATIPF